MVRRVCVFVLAGSCVFGQDRPIGQGINFYSLEKEKALGSELADNVRKSRKMLGDSAAQEYLVRIGGELATALPEGTPACSFEAVAKQSSAPMHEPSVLPGGYIFVPASLFLAAQNEAEFVGMVAHAMAHAAARHGTRMATRGQLANLSSVPLVLMGGGTGIHGSDAPVPLGFLAFTRRFELEADAIAARTMASAGYDPTALLRYVERLQTDPTGSVQQLHSPLPAREKRLSQLRQIVSELPARPYSAGTGQFERVRDEVRTLTEVRAPTLR